jgi:hypothetical protein
MSEDEGGKIVRRGFHVAGLQQELGAVAQAALLIRSLLEQVAESRNGGGRLAFPFQPESRFEQPAGLPGFLFEFVALARPGRLAGEESGRGQHKRCGE